MAEITFITQAGKEIKARAKSGTVMNLALENNVQGIYGDCGGVCSCATCHVYVSAEHWEKVGPANQAEADILEYEDNANKYSRLTCQIEIKPELDGIVLNVAND